MSQEFDIQAAVDSIGSDLFGDSDAGGVDLEVSDKPEVKAPEVTATETTTETPEVATTETETPATTPEPTSTVPKTWRKEAAAEWDKLPPTVKAEVIKREEDMFRGLEGYKASASFGESVNKALAPFMQTLRQYNIDPVAQISGLMQAHHTLAFADPQTKLNFLHKVAADYGIQLQAPAAQESGFVDPEVSSLKETVKTLESKLSNYENFQRTSEMEKAQTEIQAFMQDPANVYAQDLVNDMASLLQTNQAKNLKEAYEKAMWLNPAVREKEVTRRNAETQAQNSAKAQEAAARAKAAAAANVTTTTKIASSTAPLGSIDDTLRDTLSSINNRSK